MQTLSKVLERVFFYVLLTTEDTKEAQRTLSFLCELCEKTSYSLWFPFLFKGFRNFSTSRNSSIQVFITKRITNKPSFKSAWRNVNSFI